MILETEHDYEDVQKAFKNPLTLFQLNEVILERMNKVKLSTLTQVSQLAAIVDKATEVSEFVSEQAMVGLLNTFGSFEKMLCTHGDTVAPTNL